MSEAHVQTVRNGKRHFIVFFALNSAGMSFLAFISAEPIFNIRYIPMSFASIAGFSALACLLVFAFLLRKLHEIQPEDYRTLTEIETPAEGIMWLSAGDAVKFTLLPFVAVFCLHALNNTIPLHTPQNFECPVVHKGRTVTGDQIRVHHMSVDLDGIILNNRHLHGNHRIFIPKNNYQNITIGDQVSVTLNSGILGWVHSVNHGGQLNIMR